VGVKADAGGSIRGQGRVGKMLLHRAACNRDAAAIRRLAEAGEDVNEVEAAGNTPLHNAAFEGWLEGGWVGGAGAGRARRSASRRPTTPPAP
jgi:hypothetical protein